MRKIKGVFMLFTTAAAVALAAYAAAQVPSHPEVLVPTALVPFSVDITAAQCSTSNCSFTFPAVPAGKMLVIKHLSTIIRPQVVGTIFDFAELIASNTEDPNIGTRFTFPMTRIGVAGSSFAADTWSANAPLLAFVRAGQSARVTVVSRNGGADPSFRQATISGHLIDASQ
jgi:hypothetical protein